MPYVRRKKDWSVKERYFYFRQNKNIITFLGDFYLSFCAIYYCVYCPTKGESILITFMVHVWIVPTTIPPLDALVHIHFGRIIHRSEHSECIDEIFFVIVNK